jgi:S-DNA-T family DNA segregation ATPase FtsK/SpoIIIE
VLGSGWATLGFSAADIDPARRGVGLLLHEGGTPIRLRSFHLTDADIGVISDRAAQLRRDAMKARKSGQ